MTPQARREISWQAAKALFLRYKNIGRFSFTRALPHRNSKAVRLNKILDFVDSQTEYIKKDLKLLRDGTTHPVLALAISTLKSIGEYREVHLALRRSLNAQLKCLWDCVLRETTFLVPRRPKKQSSRKRREAEARAQRTRKEIESNSLLPEQLEAEPWLPCYIGRVAHEDGECIKRTNDAVEHAVTRLSMLRTYYLSLSQREKAGGREVPYTHSNHQPILDVFYMLIRHDPSHDESHHLSPGCPELHERLLGLEELVRLSWGPDWADTPVECASRSTVRRQGYENTRGVLSASQHKKSHIFID
jgi:hypothetical protein